MPTYVCSVPAGSLNITQKTALGLHEDVPIEVALTYGVCAAAASLLDPTSSNGVKPLSECLHLVEEFGYRPTLKL